MTASQLSDRLDDPLPLLCVGKFADSPMHVVFQMPGLARGRDRTSHGRMRDDPFEKELRPGVTREFRGPVWSRLLAHLRKKITAPQRPVHDDSYTAIGASGRIFSSASRLRSE